MSYKYFFAPSRIEQGPRLLDRLAEIRVLDGGGDDQVDWPPHQPHQRLKQTKVGIGVLPRRQSLEFDEEVVVATLGVEVVSCGRAKQGQAENAVAATQAPQFRSVLID
jgi:hypothetical protein